MRNIPFQILAGLINADRFWKKVAPPNENGCRLWIAKAVHPGGYGAFRVVLPDGRVRAAKAHRVAYALTHGEAPYDALVLHSCDVAACCAPEHLRLGTDADNLRDRRERHRSPRFKLDPISVQIARELYASGGMSQAAIGREFGVPKNVIGKAIRGTTWKEIR